MVRTLLSVLATGSIMASISAQTIDTGFLNRSVRVDGVEYRFQVYVPREFTRSVLWPIILALHGGEAYGSDGVKPTEGGLARAIRLHADRFPAIVVFPQSLADRTPGWQGLGGQAALAALDRTVTEFNGDRSRLYLTGLSAGGNGTWSLAFRYPDRFAALIVVAGWISELQSTTTGVLYRAIAPSAAPDPFAAVAQRVSKLPIWIFHGEMDRRVPVEESRKMAAALRALGADVRYTEFAGLDHNAWDSAYDRADLFEWLFQQQRK